MPSLVDLPVFYVTSVQIVRTTTDPKMDIVSVTGLASSGGWDSPQLVPTYAGKPFDDVLDLQFIAAAPAQSQLAGGFVPVSALFTLDPGQSFKGVRVHASENAISVAQIPGSGGATQQVNDCKDCLGEEVRRSGTGTVGRPGRGPARRSAQGPTRDPAYGWDQGFGSGSEPSHADARRQGDHRRSLLGVTDRPAEGTGQEQLAAL